MSYENASVNLEEVGWFAKVFPLGSFKGDSKLLALSERICVNLKGKDV